MLIRIPRAWERPEREATPESVFRARRRFLKSSTAAAAAGGAAFLAHAASAQTPEPKASSQAAGYPAPRNPRYTLDRALTREDVAAHHNIFDEFTLARDKVWKVAEGFRTEPWKVHIGGAVEKPLALDVHELARRLTLEERLYRHRCVETWAMAVPWTGFPFARLVDLAKPTSNARYVRMVSFFAPDQAPGWYASKRVFPYYEALSLEEARHELAFLATGIYGHPLPPQHGAPLRLVMPWKYGLKSIKSIVAFAFTEERPATFWSDLSPRSYTFESNVEPLVARPWPQSEETLLGTDEKRPTQLYNGYAELVAPLYA